MGAIITGFTSVSRHDYYFGGMMRLCDDALLPQYKRLTDIIHAEGCPVITQLALGGYYRETPQGRYEQVEPDDMTVAEIRFVIRQFAEAAARIRCRQYWNRRISPCFPCRGRCCGSRTCRCACKPIRRRFRSAYPATAVILLRHINASSAGGNAHDVSTECSHAARRRAERRALSPAKRENRGYGDDCHHRYPRQFLFQSLLSWAGWNVLRIQPGTGSFPGCSTMCTRRQTAIFRRQRKSRTQALCWWGHMTTSQMATRRSFSGI
ncbi:MAG: hypothetical protein IJ657_05390 [Acidaminococcaceae bacterium]|nr:hypothetical protein [Acidaminococcaceae bacterium]